MVLLKHRYRGGPHLLLSSLLFTATVLEGLLENTTPHQQHWDNSSGP